MRKFEPSNLRGAEAWATAFMLALVAVARLQIPEATVRMFLLYFEELVKTTTGRMWLSKARKAAFLSLIVAVALLVPTRVHAQDPTVKVLLFYSEECPHCHTVLEKVLPPLQEKYGQQLEVKKLEISDSGNYDYLLSLEKVYRVPPDQVGIPEMFIGPEYLIGDIAIDEKLDGLIQKYLAQGGVDYPSPASSAGTSLAPTASVTALPEPQSVVATPPVGSPITTTRVTDSTTVPGSSDAAAATTETPPAPASGQETPAIHVAYFYQVGCQECSRAQLDLQHLQARYPQMAVTSFDSREKAALLEQLGAEAGVLEDRRLIAPAVFVGGDALVGEQVNFSAVEALIQKYLATGAPPVEDRPLAGSDQVAGSILARFRSFGPLTVLGAGLIDGLNPCAFATVIFFVSYLSFVGRKGRQVLAVGLTFTLGVFLTYLGVGFGFLKAIAALPILTRAGPWVYGFTATLCVVLAVASFHDYRQALKGKPEDMRLKLPTALRKRINQIIREGSSLNALIPVAFVTGAAISLIELACTGQIYLPVILFVLGIPEMRAGAVTYLLLYNVMFIIPLVIVFLAAYWGTTSERLSLLLNQRLAQVKLATAILFVLMGAWLGVTLLG